MKKVRYILLLSAFAACGKGIGPTPKEVPELGVICGTVKFLGAWPDSTAEVRVAVYEEYPPKNFYDVKAFSDPLPVGVDSTAYKVMVSPGTYGWIMVAWRGEGRFWGPESFLGMYLDPDDPSHPGEVTVGPGEEVGGIDILADFSKRGQLPPEVIEVLEEQGVTYRPAPDGSGLGPGTGVPRR